MSDLPNATDFTDDAGQNFLANRALALNSRDNLEWQALTSGDKPQQPGAQTGALPPPVQSPGASDLPVGQRLMAAPSTLARGLLGSMLAGGGDISPSVKAGAVAAPVVAKDVGMGVIHAPGQVLGGALDFANNIVKFSDVAVKQAEQAGLPNVYFQLFDKDGAFNPKALTPAEFRAGQRAGTEALFQVPTTGKSEEVTSRMIRAAVPFLLGRGAAGSPVAGLGGSFAGEVARDFISGAVALDPAEERLSNIIDSVAPNAVTEFLKAKPEDEGTVLGRIKSGLEFAGLSAAVGGAIRVVRALKASGVADEAELAKLGEGAASKPAATAQAAPRTRVEIAPEQPTRDILRLGDPLAPAVEIKPTARDAAMAEVTAGRLAAVPTEPGAQVGPTRVAAGAKAAAPPPEPSLMSEETISAYLSGARVDNPVKINLGRIGSNEDIADVLKQVSRTIPQQAVQTNQATIAAADALGLGPEEFLKGYKGQGLNAAETTAMRFVLDSSAEQMAKFAEAAVDPLASIEAKGQFLRAFTVHRSLQSYAENARAEAGRSLQAWNILSQNRSEYSRRVADLVRNAEGIDGDLTEMAARVAALGDPLKINRFAAQSMGGQGRDFLMKVWYNSLLSSPTTMVKNLVSDFGMATWNVATTGLAEKFGPGNVVPGETAKLVQGYASSFKDAVRAAGKAMAAGESQFYPEYSAWETTPVGGPANAASRRFAQSMEYMAPEGFSPEEPAKAGLSYLKSLLPSSWLTGENDFVKVWNYRAELNRLAWRAANGDTAKYKAILDAPPIALSRQALGEAVKQGFQEPLSGAIGGGIKSVVDGMSVQIPHTNFELPLGRFIVPFVRTPFNIAKIAATNSPLGMLMREPQQILAGGPSAARDILLAKIGLGTAAVWAFADLALNNYITGKGPQNSALRQEWINAGHRPYSIEIPGLPSIQANWFEPLSLQLAAVADTFNILKFSEDEKDFGTLLPSLALGIGNAMMSRTYVQGVSRFFEALANPQSSEANRFAQGLVTGFEPQIVSRLARSMDQWERAHYAYLDSVEEKLPFLRNNLPPQRTWLGDPVPIREAWAPFLSRTPVARVISPIGLGPPPESAQPIDKWIWENRSAFPITGMGEPRGISKPARTQVFGSGPATLSVQLNPVQYDRFVELSGNALKDPDGYNMGMKDRLNALVKGTYPGIGEQREWDTATPEARAFMVTATANKYRSAAKKQLLVDMPDLAAAVDAGIRARATALTGQAQ